MPALQCVRNMMTICMTNNGACLDCGGKLSLTARGVFDTRFGIDESYDIMRCSVCHLEQICPLPTPSHLQALYEKYYNYAGIEDERYTRWRQQFYHSFFYAIWLAVDGDIAFHRLRGTGRLLDIGCNEGRGLRLFRSHGFIAEGLELNHS